VWTIYNGNTEVIYFIYMYAKTHLAAIMAIPLIFTNPEMTEVQKLFSNKGNAKRGVSRRLKIGPDDLDLENQQGSRFS
jgi:hypothetical protein